MLPDRNDSSARADNDVGFFLAVRHFWWLVLVIVVLAVGASIVATRSTPTTYTARASLIVASNNRSPDQDAVLVQGFVQYFNDPAYQTQTLQDARVSPDVTVEARAAAASPIMIIEATAPSAIKAQSAAAAVAGAFELAINKVRAQQKAAELADLQERLNALRISGDDSQRAATLASGLETRVLELQADSVNKLQELQYRAGVSENAPSLRRNVLLAILGGLLLGLVAAQGAERMGRTRRDPEPGHEPTDESGVQPAADPAEPFIPAGSNGAVEWPTRNRAPGGRSGKTGQG